MSILPDYAPRIERSPFRMATQYDYLNQPQADYVDTTSTVDGARQALVQHIKSHLHSRGIKCDSLSIEGGHWRVWLGPFSIRLTDALSMERV